MSVKKRLRDLKRMRQIVNALLKAELGYFVEKLKLKNHVGTKKRLEQSKMLKPTSLPKRLRMAFEDLGGAFIKLGQLLSLRYDLLPQNYCDEFSKLQDHVKPVSFYSIKRVIESELKKPLNQVFSHFEKKPLAAASVGQVHKAVLKNGKSVAVKVQRPNIEEIFETDISLLYFLADLLLKHYPEIKDYDPLGIVKEFEKYTLKELDYTLEAKNLERFHNNFKNDPIVKIPKVFWEYTKKRILVMDFVKGARISEVKQFSKLQSSRRKVVKNVLEAVTTQILEHKLFHADPHPGNIFLIKNNRIAFLDFGIVGRITDEMIIEIEDLIIGSVKKDVDLIVKAFTESNSIDENIDLTAFKLDVSETMSDYYNSSLEKINLARFFLDIFNLARKYKIKVPLNYTLLGKCFITLEGFSAKYYPEFNFIEFMEPKVEELIRKRFGPKNMLHSVKKTANNFKDLMVNLPSDIKTLIHAIKYGTKVNIEIDNKDLRRFTFEMDKTSNKLTLSLILASLIVASALLMQVDLEPKIYNIPTIVWFLLGFAGLVVILLIYSVFKKTEEVV